MQSTTSGEHRSTHPNDRAWARAGLNSLLCSLLLTQGGCGLFGAAPWLELCSWEEEEDLSSHVGVDPRGEWRQIDADHPDKYERLFLGQRGRLRYFDEVSDDELETNYGVSSQSYIESYACDSIRSRPLVLLDPNRGSDGNLSRGTLLVDVSPYEGGQGYVLTHNSSSDPSDLENHYSTQRLTYLHQLDEDTLRFSVIAPESNFEEYHHTFTRFAEDFPVEVEDSLDLPEGYEP